MAVSIPTLVLVLLIPTLITAQVIPNEAWDYEQVREGAHMFWWLYGANSSKRDDLPLVMWLQGGPGASSTGFGNFIELGPLNVNLQPRKFTWVSKANILFVDNPVGTGYSYVENSNLFTKNVEEIAQDLVALFGAVLKKHPQLEKNPFYIFCESYGGKMTAAFGVALNQAIKNKTLSCNFKGVALGDSWISPVDTVASWGPYLQALSLVNSANLADMNTTVNEIRTAMKDGKFNEATELWGTLEDQVEEYTDGVDFYNILIHNGDPKVLNFTTGDLGSREGRREKGILERMARRHLGYSYGESLSDLMNGPIRKKLGIIPNNVIWGGQSGEVFSHQSGDFMKDVISSVNTLLNSGLTVVVYSGQLDLICCTPGTWTWVERLQWKGLKNFLAAQRIPLYAPSKEATKNTGAFFQTYANFYFYWIMDAGHMVPKDNGEMALEMLTRVITQ